MALYLGFLQGRSSINPMLEGQVKVKLGGQKNLNHLQMATGGSNPKGIDAILIGPKNVEAGVPEETADDVVIALVGSLEQGVELFPLVAHLQPLLPQQQRDDLCCSLLAREEEWCRVVFQFHGTVDVQVWSF